MFDDSMGFSTYNDFFKRRETIKNKYKKMGKEEQAIYKLYLYAQRDMSTKKVDLIWEYLNEPDNSLFCPTIEELKKHFVESLEKNDNCYVIEDDEFEY